MRRIHELLRRVEQALAVQHAATRSGARIVPGDTYEQFAAGVARILEEEPDGSYLFVPEQEDFAAFVLRTTGKSIAEHEGEWRRNREEQHTEQ